MDYFLSCQPHFEDQISKILTDIGTFVVPNFLWLIVLGAHDFQILPWRNQLLWQLDLHELVYVALIVPVSLCQS